MFIKYLFLRIIHLLWDSTFFVSDKLWCSKPPCCHRNSQKSLGHSLVPVLLTVDKSPHIIYILSLLFVHRGEPLNFICVMLKVWIAFVFISYINLIYSPWCLSFCPFTSRSPIYFRSLWIRVLSLFITIIKIITNWHSVAFRTNGALLLIEFLDTIHCVVVCLYLTNRSNPLQQPESRIHNFWLSCFMFGDSFVFHWFRVSPFKFACDGHEPS